MSKIAYNVNALGLAEIGTESLLWPDKEEFPTYIKVKRAGAGGGPRATAATSPSIKGCKWAALGGRELPSLPKYKLHDAGEAVTQNKVQKHKKPCLCAGSSYQTSGLA